MEITSYLLGKKSSGGGSNLQQKSVTITTNTTQSITADTGYDGLSSVSVTTNVPGGSSYNWSAIGYNSEPDFISDSYNDAKDIYDNWDSSITDYSNKYENDCTLMIFPLVDTSSATTWNYMFSGCSALQEVPQLNFNNFLDMQNTFLNCYSLKKVGNIINTRTGGTLSMKNCFSGCRSLETAPVVQASRKINFEKLFYGCSSLKNVPQFTLDASQGISSMQNAFVGCSSLTNESLNNIMGTIKSVTYYSGTKTLKYIGLTSEQATICTSLSNWTSLSSDGWTTGY